MSEQYSAQRVLQLFKRLELQDWQCQRVYEAKRRLEDLHYLQSQHREGEITEEQREKIALARGWIADLYFDGHVSQDWSELVKFFGATLPKMGSDLAAVISELGNAAIQFPQIQPDAIVNAAELLYADVEGRLGIKGDSPQEVLQNCREMMFACPIGGSPAHIAAQVTLRKFRTHVQQVSVDEICQLNATRLLDKLDELHTRRLDAYVSQCELSAKWNGWTVIGAPTEQTRQCERDLLEAEAHKHDRHDTEAILVGVMKHVATMMEVNGVDAGAMRRWLDAETCPPECGMAAQEKENIAAGVKASILALRSKADSGPIKTTKSNAAPASFYLVTLDQIAAIVGRKKRTLENYLKKMPNPHVQGTGGKPSQWIWDEIRPWLEREFVPNLPQVFPDSIR